MIIPKKKKKKSYSFTIGRCKLKDLTCKHHRHPLAFLSSKVEILAWGNSIN